MLAPNPIPEQYVKWNKLYGSPFGFRKANSLKSRILRRLHLIDLVYRRDPFAYQPNSSTRAFEYPWAFHVLPRVKGRVLEIGGGMSGLQFVLSEKGCRVINIDPGQEELRSNWAYSKGSFAELNKRFGTDVELRATTIEKAGLEKNSFDCAYSISVLEHLSISSVSTIMKHVWRCLKPGAPFVLTIDLFLDLAPFTPCVRNDWGTNIDLRWLLEQAPFVLEEGNRHELFGFDQFNAKEVLVKLDSYLKDYPSLCQCLVLRKTT